MPINEPSQPKKFQEVVTVFLTHQEKVLVLKRSTKVGTYQGHWAGVSGYVENDDPLIQAYTEMSEEVGLSRQDVVLVETGTSLEVMDETLDLVWRVHPFLFAVDNPDKIRLDWENTEMRWLDPHELAGLKTVPGLRQALERVLRIAD
jgi:hypothetical protein